MWYNRVTGESRQSEPPPVRAARLAKTAGNLGDGYEETYCTVADASLWTIFVLRVIFPLRTLVSHSYMSE